MAQKIANGYKIVTSLALLLAALRLFFALGGAGVFGTAIMNDIMSMLDEPIADAHGTIVMPFLTLGLIGLVAAIGMLLRKDWATYLTIAVCAITIAYDAWATVAIQASAIFGMVIPIVLLLYIGADMVRTRSMRAAA